MYSVYRTQTALTRALDRIFTEDVSDRFQSYATTISGRQSLLVAKLDRMESYERTSTAKALGIPLPEVVVNLSFPVEYNFSVSLQAPWRFEKKDNMIWVFAPELSGQTPAVNVSKMKFEVKKGSFIRNETAVKERLQQELSAYLAENSIKLREDVRSEARSSVEQFVRTWVRSQFAEAPPDIPIKVLFPNQNADTSVLPPR